MINQEWVKFGFKTSLMTAQRELNIDTSTIDLDNLTDYLTKSIEDKFKKININTKMKNYIYELISISESLCRDCYLTHSNKTFKIFEYFSKDDLTILLQPRYTLLFIYAVKEFSDDNNIKHNLNTILDELSNTLKNDIEQLQNTLTLLNSNSKIDVSLSSKSKIAKDEFYKKLKLKKIENLNPNNS